MAWGKLWRTDFLLENKLYFPEGLCFEDNLVHWQGVILAKKISIVPEPFYYYRQRDDSIMSQRNIKYYDLIKVYSMILDFLNNNKVHESYKKIFLRTKVDWIFHFYHTIEGKLKAEFLGKIKNVLGEAEKDYMRKERYIDYSVTYFFYCITGDRRIFLMYLRRRIRSFLGTFKRNLIKFFRTYVLKNTNKSN
jgi:hypothetical protein